LGWFALRLSDGWGFWGGGYGYSHVGAVMYTLEHKIRPALHFSGSLGIIHHRKQKTKVSFVKIFVFCLLFSLLKIKKLTNNPNTNTPKIQNTL
jgi:hypothetical protein